MEEINGVEIEFKTLITILKFLRLRLEKSNWLTRNILIILTLITIIIFLIKLIRTNVHPPIDKVLMLTYMLSLASGTASLAYMGLFQQKNMTKFWSCVYKVDFYCKALKLKSKSNTYGNLVLTLMPYMIDLCLGILPALFFNIYENGLFDFIHLYFVITIWIRTLQFGNMLIYLAINSLFTNYYEQLNVILKKMNCNHDDKIEILKLVTKCHQHLDGLIKMSCEINATQATAHLLQSIVYLLGQSFKLIQIVVYHSEVEDGLAFLILYIVKDIFLTLIIIVPPSICSEKACIQIKMLNFLWTKA